MAPRLAARLAEQPLVGAIDELHLGGVSFYDLAEQFHDRRDFTLLDSQTHDAQLGDYSFLAFEPIARFVSNGRRYVVQEGGIEHAHDGDPLDALQRLLDAYSVVSTPDTSAIPFRGGAIGYLSYELGRQIEVLPHSAVDDLLIPDCYLCFYDFAVAFEHASGRMFLCHLRTPGDDGARKAAILGQLRHSRAGAFAATAPARWRGKTHLRYQSDLTALAYQEAVARIKEYIRAGDVYQVNMTQRFCVPLGDMSPWDLFKHARAINPAPFAGYLHCDDHTIVSCSPERFLRVRDRLVETRPIKGTIARGRTDEEDARNQQALLASVKNRAELAMIVDLLRNDIGRVCKPGTVRVRAFPELESYASVHHLVATITGELEDHATVASLVRATFPGGSITGAPKIRAMEIIDELEPVTRGIYTGSIGYIGFDGTIDLNIAIRTIVIKDRQAYFGAGGGVVADSDEKDEYEESLLKASKLFEALEASRHHLEIS
jgi:para-aminobenzoate synthetase component 1